MRNRYNFEKQIQSIVKNNFVQMFHTLKQDVFFLYFFLLLKISVLFQIIKLLQKYRIFIENVAEKRKNKLTFAVENVCFVLKIYLIFN